MRLKWIGIAVLGLLASSCTQIEHRSDQPTKKELIVIESPIKLDKKWSVSAGDGIGKHDVKLLLARAGSNLFVVDHNGNVMSIKESNGNKNWQVALNTNISAGPAVADGKLVIATTDGKIIALESDSGKFAWSWKSTGEVLSTPKISNNIVFVHTMDGGLTALNATDGRQVWHFAHNLPPLVLRRASTPAIYKTNIIAGFSNGKLISMNAIDGSFEWVQDISNPKGRNDLQRMVDITADPVVKADTVYAASYQGNLRALTADSGQLKWERELPSYAGLAVDSKMLYISETKGDVLAIDTSNGATFWLQSDLHGRRLSKPAIIGNYIVVGDEDGLLHWLDKTNGKIVGRIEVDGKGVEATPVVNDNIVYVLGRSGKLVALEVK